MLHGRAVATLGAVCGTDCVVAVNGNRYDNHNGGTFHYCFTGSTWTNDQKAAVASGFDYWVTALGSNPYAPDLSVSEGSGSDCDLYVMQQDLGSGHEDVIAMGNGNADGATATIFFNTTYSQNGYNLSNMTLGTYAWVGAHEFGHVIGFDHAVGDNCSRDLTVMYFSVPPNLSSGPPSTVKCVDQDATDNMYSIQGGGDDVQQEVHDYDWICDFHYTVTYWIQYWGGSWHIVDVIYTLDYIDNCVPRMEG